MSGKDFNKIKKKLLYIISSIFVVGCSHQRAWEYFVESISKPYTFPVDKCEPTNEFGRCKDGNSGAYMGIAADRRLVGMNMLQITVYY